MTDNTISSTIEILGKPYPVRCLESELKSLQQAAKFLHEKMSEVQKSGKAINLERIAIITALNIANLFLQLEEQNHQSTHKINQRITHLHSKLDTAIHKSIQAELIYSTE